MTLNYKEGAVEAASPEATIFALARVGGAPFEAPTRQEMAYIVQEINPRIIKIHFPWLWKHEVVQAFSNYFAPQIDIAALSFVIQETEKRCLNRELHWIEKINLFRLYGLHRIIGSPISVETLRLIQKNQTNLSFPLISARNSYSIVNQTNKDEWARSIYAIKTRNTTRAVAEFQLYYYTNMEKLIEQMRQMANTHRESIIPIIFFSIYNTFNIDAKTNELIQDKILTRFPSEIRNLISK
jgi:hypothetical protein